jgi:hypothetical protein
MPQNVKIGIQHTSYQQIKNEETNVIGHKDRSLNFKMEMETNKRITRELRYKKKKELEVYEKLEQDLTLQELQDDSHMRHLMSASSEERMDRSGISTNVKGEIRIADQNIFNQVNSGGPMMQYQED